MLYFSIFLQRLPYFFETYLQMFLCSFPSPHLISFRDSSCIYIRLLEAVLQQCSLSLFLSLSLSLSPSPSPWLSFFSLWVWFHIHSIVISSSSLISSSAESSLLFFPALLRYYKHILKFKVYNMMIWYMYILQNDYHNRVS